MMETIYMLIIKPERKDDYAQITKINDAAFGQPNEGRLVENICQSSFRSFIYCLIL